MNEDLKVTRGIESVRWICGWWEKRIAREGGEDKVNEALKDD